MSVEDRSPEERAEMLLGFRPADEPPDLAEAIDVMAAEFDAPRAVVLAEIVGEILKAVQVAGLRRMTGVYVEE